MKVSVAMGYKDRLKQLEYTLRSLERFSFDGEIVICDDFSTAEENPALLISKYPTLDIQVVHPEKKYLNPCMAYNTAFSACTGDVIIVQNPECFWTGNISKICEEQLSKKKYLSFACLSISQEQTSALWGGIIDHTSLQGVWYNHSKARPVPFHLCVGILKSDLDTYLFGGFDERFSEGYDYDDAEFVHRISAEKFDIVHIDSPYVVHQWHPKFWQNKSSPQFKSLLERNKQLYEQVLKGYVSKEYIGSYPGNRK